MSAVVAVCARTIAISCARSRARSLALSLSGRINVLVTIHKREGAGRIQHSPRRTESERWMTRLSMSILDLIAKDLDGMLKECPPLLKAAESSGLLPEDVRRQKAFPRDAHPPAWFVAGSNQEPVPMVICALQPPPAECGGGPGEGKDQSRANIAPCMASLGSDVPSAPERLGYSRQDH